MFQLTRRNFTRLTMALGATARSSLQAATRTDSKLHAALDASAKRHEIPAVSAMAANADHTLYQGAFGHRDKEKTAPVTTRSIFRIASMTKPITAVAAMQLFEQRQTEA